MEYTYFQKIKKTGEGSSGVVYKGRIIFNNKLVAMKEIKRKIVDEGIPASIIREISVLKELKHQNIVRLQNVFINDGYIALIFEYLTMDLKTYLDRLPTDFTLSHAAIRSYLYQISSAIAFCHKRRIFHRDLCPQNILIDRKGMIKVADFGMARSFGVTQQVYTHEVVILWYRCPEILLGTSRYSPAIDVWSIGCIFAEMFVRKPLFQGDSEINQLHKIFGILGTPDKQAWPNIENLPYYIDGFPKWKENRLKSNVKNLPNVGVHLLKQMFKYNPCQRISAKRILEHPYFASFNKNLLVPIIF